MKRGWIMVTVCTIYPSFGRVELMSSLTLVLRDVSVVMPFCWECPTCQAQCSSPMDRRVHIQAGCGPPPSRSNASEVSPSMPRPLAASPAESNQAPEPTKRPKAKAVSTMHVHSTVHASPHHPNHTHPARVIVLIVAEPRWINDYRNFSHRK